MYTLAVEAGGAVEITPYPSWNEPSQHRQLDKDNYSQFLDLLEDVEWSRFPKEIPVEVVFGYKKKDFGKSLLELNSGVEPLKIKVEGTWFDRWNSLEQIEEVVVKSIDESSYVSDNQKTEFKELLVSYHKFEYLLDELFGVAELMKEVRKQRL